MNAFEKAMAAIEKLIARGQRPAPKAKRPPKRATKASAAQYSKLQRAGVPRNTARRAARELECVPPRAPDVDRTALTESFAAPFVPDPVMGPRGVDLRPDVNFTGLTQIRGGGGYAHRAGVILANGELLDDWRELQHAS